MIIGITGGVGTGKSTILDILEKDYNAKLIIADDVARELQMPQGRCYDAIVDEFGEEILDDTQPERPIDRKKLADIVFSDPGRLDDLNFIVHPLTKIEIMLRISGYYYQDSEALIVIEAALMIEAGYTDLLDELWAVTADKEVRIARLMEGRGYTREKCEAVMAAQLCDDEYKEEADFVIDNSGSIEEVKEKIAAGIRRISDQ